jgi:hypothetical protein
VPVAEIVDHTLHEWMTRGGDERIVLDPVTGLNRYASAPFPREVLAFASSTANDLGPEADAWLRSRFAGGAAHLRQGAGYGAALDEARASIRAAYGLPDEIDVFFAASGTDLEYVGLLAVAGRKPGGIVNHLLGADEVGSGCIYSAAGEFFARTTALDHAVAPGEPVPGLPPVAMADTPVRSADGEAHDSAGLADQLAASIESALADGKFPLVHVVHGSKTGLVLPALAEVDALRARYGDDVCFVVDACQARITSAAIAQYLARGMIVFITGSKFMGGPPFSGFALLPSGMAARAAPMAEGMARVFRRAEVPAAWPGRDLCEDGGNPGLALRLAASLFELTRFQELSLVRVSRVVDAFTHATDALARQLGVRKVACGRGNQADEPIERRTLVTLDLCHDETGALRRQRTFEEAMAIHKALIGEDIRLGQPVRCVRLAGDGWGASLRIGLSMPQIVRLDAVDDAALAGWFAANMDRIGQALGRHLDG